MADNPSTSLSTQRKRGQTSAGPGPGPGAGPGAGPLPQPVSGAAAKTKEEDSVMEDWADDTPRMEQPRDPATGAGIGQGQGQSQSQSQTQRQSHTQGQQTQPPGQEFGYGHGQSMLGYNYNPQAVQPQSSTFSYPPNLRSELSVPPTMNAASSQDSGSGVIRRYRSQGSRQRPFSESYFGESSINFQTSRISGTNNPMMDSTHSAPNVEDIKTYHLKQSRRLPYWAWFLLAKSLGIKLHEFDKPWFGVVMYILTVLFSAGYLTLRVWYTVYDIKSVRTNQTILTGLVTIMLVTYFCTLGPYANKLASKLFQSQKFVESVRLHSRTIFKVSSAGILVLLGIAVMGLNVFNASKLVSNSYCAQNVTVSVSVCRAMYGMRVGYSFFCLLWNLLVGIVLLSVCRTHTIGIRRFIRQLEEDGKLYESFRRAAAAALDRQSEHTREEVIDSSDDLDDQFVWDDTDISPVREDYPTFQRPLVGPMSPGAPVTPTRRPGQPVPPNSENPPNVPQSPKQKHNTQQGQGQGQGQASGQQVQAQAQAPPTPKEMVSFPLDHAPSETNGVVTMGASAAAAGTATTHQGAGLPHLPQNRPIIIIKEGSIANSEEMENVSMNSEHADGILATSTQRLINPDPPSHASRSTRSMLDSPQNSLRVELSSPRRVPSSTCDDTDDRLTDDNMSVGPRLLTPDEILLNYWRISCRLRSTGTALQRWLVAWVFFITIWCSTFIIHWISHEAKLADIAEFILPLLLLPMLCAAYGEVNNEGRRMIQAICPMEERMNMLQFLQFQPLQLTAFGFPISYFTILKVLGALALAFCTRIVLDEFKFK